MDQAAGLKDLLAGIGGVDGRGGAGAPDAVATAPAATAKPQTCRAIAVAGGKGGVGKTTVAVNLGMALAMSGDDVLLLDADMGLANVDVLLGLTPTRHIGHLLDGSATLEELILTAPHGLRIVPAGSGARRLAQLPNGEHAAIIRAFDQLARPPKYLIVDTAAGVSDNVSMFAAAADDVVIVVCDEPASLTDAYAMIKVLSREFGVRRFRMVANMMQNEGSARQLHRKLSAVCDRFLDVIIDFTGWIPQDERLRQAIRRQRAVVDLWPSSRSALAFKQIADTVAHWTGPERAGFDRIGFFGDRAAPAGRMTT